MFRYSFLCTDEDAVREKIDWYASTDHPTGKTIWGFDTQRGGAHFTENGKRVRGYFIMEDERPDERWRPFRVSFCGRFRQREDQTYFTVWIYPSLFMLLFLAVAFALCAVRLDGLLLAAAAIALNCWELTSVSRRAFDFFRGLFEPYARYSQV